MAVLEPYLVKTGLEVSTLSLKADPGEAFLVQEIQVDNTKDLEFTKVSIDRVTLAYLSTFDEKQNQFYFARSKAVTPQLMRWMYDKGMFPGFPVAEGQEFVVDVTGATKGNVRIIYQKLEPGDISPDMPCGSASKEYIFWNYGTNSADIGAGGSGLIDKCLTPKEFPDFPFGATVPPKTQIEILALLVGNYRKGAEVGGNYKRLKFMKGREVLFDEDRVGFYIESGYSNYPFHCQTEGLPVNPFPEPLVFGPGDELNLELSVGTTDLAADASLFCLIERVKKLE